METIKHVTDAIVDKAKAVIHQVADTVWGPTETDKDVLNVLRQDHRLVASLFEQLETISNRKDPVAEGLFAQLKFEIEAHAHAEEKLFYPILNKEDAFLVRKAFAAHDTIRGFLKELVMIPMDTPAWTSKLTTLKQSVQNHVDEEETRLFKLARRTLSETQLRELGACIEREKKDLTADVKGVSN